MVLAMIQHRKSKKMKAPLGYTPKVSVIVPAYNEELTVTRTIENLLMSDYPLFDIVFVDDGSKDQTFANVKAAFSDRVNVQILTKPNGGKASALNYGLLQATGDILVCIDADTLLLPDAISKMIPYFVECRCTICPTVCLPPDILYHTDKIVSESDERRIGQLGDFKKDGECEDLISVILPTLPLRECASIRSRNPRPLGHLHWVRGQGLVFD